MFQDQDALLHELHNVRYFDVFEFNAGEQHWACFMCNHPEKMFTLLQDGNPVISVSNNFGWLGFGDQKQDGNMFTTQI